MSLALRILLIVSSVAALFFCASKIKRSTLKIDTAIFWFVLSTIIVLLSVFPQLAIGLSNLLGIESPANFVFLVMIFLLLVKTFQQTLTIAKIESKLETITFEIARNKFEKDEYQMTAAIESAVQDK